MKKLVIFDLDGTLLDTIGDLAAACDYALSKNSLDCYTLEQYKTMIGSGILRLVDQIVPEELRNEELIAVLRKDFLSYYFENIDNHTVCYEGIKELLAALQAKGVKMAVASNKFQDGTRKLVNSFFPHIEFLEVLGQRKGVPLKPDPQIINDIIQSTGYTADEILYVGDSGIDMETATAAGVDSVGVTWGFRTREELLDTGAKYIADEALEILKYIE